MGSTLPELVKGSLSLPLGVPIRLGSKRLCFFSVTLNFEEVRLVLGELQPPFERTVSSIQLRSFIQHALDRGCESQGILRIPFRRRSRSASPRRASRFGLSEKS